MADEARMPLPTCNIRIEFCRHTTLELVPDIKQLLASTPWKPNYEEEAINRYVKWRYCDLDAAETMLAYDGRRPVAMIASYTRPYIVGHRVVRLREASDWFCLPEYRHLGLGLRLMYSLMDEQEPLLIIGGNENAQAVLSALGWRRLADVSSYILPLSTKWLVNKVWRWLRLPFSGTGVAKLFATPWPRLLPGRRLSLPWRQVALSEALPMMTPPAGAYELIPLVREHEVQWLHAAPKEMGTFFCLVFPENIGPGGFSIGRLYSYGNSKYIKLIHIQTSTPSVEVYAGMLAETIRYAYEHGADVAEFRASCPSLRRALRQFGSIWAGPTRSYWWANSGASPGTSLHLTFLRGDDGIRPYPAPKDVFDPSRERRLQSRAILGPQSQSKTNPCM